MGAKEGNLDYVKDAETTTSGWAAMALSRGF
jgi:hypothetical protein